MYQSKAVFVVLALILLGISPMLGFLGEDGPSESGGVNGDQLK
jgi:hypothetical protein